MARNEKTTGWRLAKNAPGIKMSWRNYGSAFHCAARERYARYCDFNLPFISLGQVGEGKLMVIGNRTTTASCVARTVTVGAVVLK